ncbi:MAG: S-methyl-5-thioribose-1-phosphate isomerase [Candidatus Omnitrophica bacterium]|nr:S-methyl-5-thioribose-1-phosphate isomerase [Candidatus Omnitrophota bacterium]
MKKESPLFWPAYLKGDILFVLDETLVPKQLKYVKVRNIDEAVAVICEMKTRAFGQFLVVLSTFLLEFNRQPQLNGEELLEKIRNVAHALNHSRPTFPFSEVTSVVVHWAHGALDAGQDVRAIVIKNVNGYLQGIRHRRLDRVAKIAANIKDGDSVLTHCNVSGELAMAAAICREQKKDVQFYCTETRPYFQGAKLTYWELKQMGADVTLVADNAIATLMADKMVNKVIVGSDRNCANGDFANKIGTYQIAVLANEFKVPMLVLTQPSQKIKSGADIPVEIRDESELLQFNGRKVFSSKVKGLYPGFDVVPHHYVRKEIAIDVH